MMRLTRLLSKRHGAFKMFCSRFRDALFIVNKVDVEIVKETLQKEG